MAKQRKSFAERAYDRAAKAYVKAESDARLAKEDLIEAQKLMDEEATRIQTSLWNEENNDATNG